MVSYRRKYVQEVLVNRLGGPSMSRKSVVRLTDRPDVTLDVYRGRNTITTKYSIYLQKRSESFGLRTRLIKSNSANTDATVLIRHSQYGFCCFGFIWLLVGWLILDLTAL